MMSKTRSYDIEEATPDGNCAYNAFILALVDPKVFAAIDKELAGTGENPNQAFADLINELSPILKVNTWSEVKTALLDLSQDDRKSLETTLARPLRNLAIKGAKKDPAYVERTKEPLFAAFSDYVNHELGIVIRGDIKDDIFNQHVFIEQKFAKLYGKVLEGIFSSEKSELDIDQYNSLKAKSATELTKAEQAQLAVIEKQFNDVVPNIQDELFQWWQKEGLKQFLGEMKLDKKWSGDLELFYLAQYFRTNLAVHREAFASPREVFGDRGQLPVQTANYNLSEADIRQLCDRGVIDSPYKTIKLPDNKIRLELPKETKALKMFAIKSKNIRARLQQLPDYDLVEPFINSIGIETDLKNSLIPEGCSEACITQLLKRNIIQKTEAGYLFQVDKSVALQRIEAVANYNNIAKEWSKQRKKSLATLHLVNDHAVHYNTLHAQKAPQSKESKVEATKAPIPVFNEVSYIEALTSVGFWASESKWTDVVQTISAAQSTSLKSNEVYTFNQDTDIVTISSVKKRKDRVEYSLSKDKKVLVDRETQIQLDGTLAKELQQEEYEKFKLRKPK